MNQENFRFIPFDSQDILALTRSRTGEKKLGEAIFTDWDVPPKKTYVLIGIQEDIGPQANFGLAGTQKAFPSFLPYFLNMQSTSYYEGNNLAVWGYVQQNVSFSSIQQAQSLVSQLDELLTALLIPIFKNGQIPILIGGGHNNAYPLIRAFNKAQKKTLSVVNLDPHADCRTFNERHSGNSFSLAIHRQELHHYSVLGLHKAYNNQWIYDFLNYHHCFFTFFEEYIFDQAKFQHDLQKVINLDARDLGIELDLDSIKNMPSSARTPSGFSIEEARKYIIQLARQKQRIAYLHLPEGAPTNPQEEHFVGKTLAYLVHDFLTNTQ